MRREPRILPECYCDTLLVQLLTKSIPNHQADGVGQVIKVLGEKFQNQKAVGLIDSDKALKKHKASYFTHFITQKMENDAILKKHPNRENYLIMLAPALEKFILKAARDCGIPQSEIPFTEMRLKELSKSKKAENEPKLKDFLNRIIQKKSPGTETLKAWIREILGDDD